MGSEVAQLADAGHRIHSHASQELVQSSFQHAFYVSHY